MGIDEHPVLTVQRQGDGLIRQILDDDFALSLEVAALNSCIAPFSNDQVSLRIDIDIVWIVKGARWALVASLAELPDVGNRRVWASLKIPAPGCDRQYDDHEVARFASFEFAHRCYLAHEIRKTGGLAPPATSPKLLLQLGNIRLTRRNPD